MEYEYDETVDALYVTVQKLPIKRTVEHTEGGVWVLLDEAGDHPDQKLVGIDCLIPKGLKKAIPYITTRYCLPEWRVEELQEIASKFE